MRMRFTGFRQLCEVDDKTAEFQKSNMDGVLARSLNITPRTNDDKFDQFAAAPVQFTGRALKSLNKLMGFEDDNEMKMMRVLKRNQFGVQLEDITGKCDKDLLNRGRDGPGHIASRDNPHAPCSPTTGQKFWISAKDWDFVRNHLPPGGGGGGAGGPGGGMGGPPMGGGGAPPAPGGAGGGAPPPPPG